MKTIRRLPTRLVLETEAGLVLQRLWYRPGRRQDTSELEHRSGIAGRPTNLNEENMEDSIQNTRLANGNTYDGVERRGGIQLVAQQAEQCPLGAPWNGLGRNLVKAKLRATLTRTSCGLFQVGCTVW